MDNQFPISLTKFASLMDPNSSDYVWMGILFREHLAEKKTEQEWWNLIDQLKST